MAAHNIYMFEQGNSSEATNSNASPYTRSPHILQPALGSIFPVDDEFNSDLEEFFTDQNRISQKKLYSRWLYLRFAHEVASEIFTGEYIFPKETKLELVDTVTGQQVRYGPLALAQVEIFVLTDNEHSIHIMLHTSGNYQNPYLRLEGGVVSIDEIKIKHTSKHMKKLKVRLGARVVDQPEEIEVIYGVTGYFTVKDKHLKSKKRYPPLPTDDVWRLEHIYRYGRFRERLNENGIKTVEDFLLVLQNNPQSLRQILGKSMSENNWKKVATHAKTCNLDGRKYLYHHVEMEQNFTVVFNVAGQVMWLDSGCGLHHFTMLSEPQKVYAQKLVEIALANWENVEKSDNEIFIMDNLSPSLSRLFTVDEGQSLEFQNTLVSTTLDEMCVPITSPGHSGFDSCGYQNYPIYITSAIPESGDLKKFIQYLSSDAIQFDDRELGQTNNSAAETSATQFHGLQHDETMNLSQNQFMVSENEDGTNTLQRQMNVVSLVPEASLCKDKNDKSWIKIRSILKWLALKRFVKLKKVCLSKKRKVISK